MGGTLVIDGALAIATFLASSALVIGLVAQRTSYAAPLVVSYFLHLVIGAGIYETLGFYAPDARGYDSDAVSLARFWTGGQTVEPTLTTGKEGFTYLMASLYATLGHVPTLGVIINGMAAALLVPVAASAAERLGARGRRAAWIVALAPPFLFWGSLLLREALVWLCIAISVWALAGLAKRANGPDVVWLCASLLGLFWLRGTVAILIGAAGLLALVAVKRRGGGMFVAAGLGALVLASPLANRVSAITGRYDLQAVNTSRSALARHAASGFETVSYDGPIGLIGALPDMLPRVLFGPFPWEWPSLNPLFALDAVIWLVVLRWAWIGAQNLGWRTCLVCLLPAAAILLALAVTSGNYGTMERLRSLSLIALAPVAAGAATRPRPPDEAIEQRTTSARRSRT